MKDSKRKTNHDMIIVGDDCTNCKFYSSPNNHTVICKARNKKYFYGQSIPCVDKQIEREVK